MSRTDNTMPIHLQEEDGRQWPHLGGGYKGIGEDCHYPERQARQRVRLALLRGEEPEPTRHRHGAKYMYY